MTDRENALFGTDLAKAIAVADEIRDSGDDRLLPIVLRRLDTILDSRRERPLLLLLIEACAAIAHVEALPVLRKVLEDKAVARSVHQLAAGAIAAVEIATARGAVGAQRLRELAQDRRFRESAFYLNKRALELDPEQRWQIPRRPWTRESLEARLSDWVFDRSGTGDIPSSSDMTESIAARFLDDAAKKLGLETARDWALAAAYFEAENFHGLVAEASTRAANARR